MKRRGHAEPLPLRFAEVLRVVFHLRKGDHDGLAAQARMLGYPDAEALRADALERYAQHKAEVAR